MITFVVFHVDFDQQGSEYLEQSTVMRKKYLFNLMLRHKSNDYIAMLNLMFKSAKLFHPDCKCVVLTDLRTDFSRADAADAIYRYDVDPRKIILSRLIAQLEFLKNNCLQDDLLFLDSDVLVNANLEHIFEKDFDVGVTFRESRRGMPINGGVLFCSRRKRDKIYSFFKLLHSIYMEKYSAQDIWWGDQFALIDTVGIKDLSDNTVVDVDGTKILSLSCDKYNFSPKRGYRSIFFALNNRKILHFKGKRKSMMQFYWELYLAKRGKQASVLFLSTIANRMELMYMIMRDMFSRKANVRNS